MKSQSDNGYTVITASSVQEVEKIRDHWKEMYPHPFAEIDYFLTVVNSRPEIIRPHVLLLMREGRPDMLLVGRIENDVFEFKVGNRALLKSSVRSLKIVEGGIVGNPSHDNCSALLSELMNSLNRREADCISFKEIPTDSYIYRFAKKTPKFLYRDHFPGIDHHYKMTLPASMDLFYKARKRSRNLRRLNRRLEREYKGNTSVRYIREKGEIGQFCMDAELISKKTYQSAYGEGFLDNIEAHQLLTSPAERNRLRAYVLYVEDTPCAFWWGYIFEKALHLIDTGYDPSYKRYQVGTVLMLKVIEDMCSDSDVKYINFGRGTTIPKRRLCDIKWEEASFYIFQPSLKGLKLNTIRVLAGASYKLKNILLKRLKLKKKWIKYERNRVAAKLNSTK